MRQMMIPTIVGVAMAAHLVRRADKAMRQGRDVLALVFCTLAAVFLVEGLKLDGALYRKVFEALP